jgi:hypothetical protein
MVSIFNLIGQRFEPSIDSIKIIPKNPTVNDNITLFVYLSNVDTCIHYKKEIKNDSIDIWTNTLYPCFNSKKLIDTISLGKLSQKSYKIHYRAWDIYKMCGDVDTNFVLTISEPNNITEGESVQSLVIYPNPVINDKIIIEVDNNWEKKTIQFININGVVVKEINFMNHQNEFSLLDLEAGMYIVKIYSQNSFIIWKLIKK